VSVRNGVSPFEQRLKESKACKETAVYDWFERFENGQVSLDDAERGGRQLQKNDETVEKAQNVDTDQNLRIRNTANIQFSSQ